MSSSKNSDHSKQRVGRRRNLHKLGGLAWDELQIPGPSDAELINDDEGEVKPGASMPMPDRGEMRRFLRMLKTSKHRNGMFTWQTFPARGVKTNGIPKFKTERISSAALMALETFSRDGQNVAIVPNVLDGKGRSAHNCVATPWLFVDCDGGATTESQLRGLAIPPHIIVETSPGNFHAYWRVRGCTPRRFKEIQSALARLLGSDRAVCDPSRCLRLPGTLNHKVSPPFLARMVHPRADRKRGKAVKLSKFVSKIGLTLNSHDAIEAKQSSATTLQRIRDALRLIDPDPRDTWLRVGQAIHSEFPNDAGYELWAHWAMQSSKFDDNDQQRTWEAFVSDGGVTIASLFHLAGEAGADATGTVPTDDAELAELLASTGKNRIRFDQLTQQWWSYSDGTWTRSMRGHCAMKFAAETVKSIVASNGDPSLRRKLGLGALGNAVKLMQLDDRLHIDEAGFDSNAELLAVRNGVIELKTGAFRSASPEDYLTRKAAVDFDRDAQCPEFDAFLLSVCNGDKKLRKYLLRLLGYILTGHTREQQLYLFIGQAGNGKGTLINLLLDLLGDYATTVPPAMLMRAYSSNPNAPSPALMKIRGARLLACTEMIPGRLDEAFVKQVSGQDRISGREAYGQQQEFLPVGKLVLSTNDDPHISVAADAMWRRIRVVPFDRSFLGRNADLDLSAKLRTERSGILNALVAAATEYLKKGLTSCTRADAATGALRARSDTVVTWLENCCRVEDGLTQKSSDAYDSYRRATKGEGRTPLGQRAFKKELDRLGYPSSRSRHHNRFSGFALLKD